MKTKRIIAMLLCCSGILFFSRSVHAQNQSQIIEPADNESLPTILSIKVSGGYGFGRAREHYGDNGTDQIWWSTGQGEKMDAAIDIPLLPIDVINSDADENEPERFSIVGLEMEFASGYHISDGGTTVNGPQTSSWRYTYIPITLGFNARATFGAGLPSAYIGAGGGIYLKGIYEQNISTANSATSVKNTFDPPIPFALYGLIGLEIPLLYSPDDGNSMLDLFVQAKLSEATNYIYKYTSTISSPTSSSTTVISTGAGYGATASNVALSLGIKFNIY